VEVRITGRHADLGAKVKAYALEKLEPLSRYYQRTRYVEVVFDGSHLGHEIEVIAHLERGKPIIASVRHKDPFAAIDLATTSSSVCSRARRRRRTPGGARPPTA